MINEIVIDIREFRFEDRLLKKFHKLFPKSRLIFKFCIDKDLSY